MQGEKAFTLIELLVTIAIVGILASLSVAIFSEYKSKSYDAIAIQQGHDAMVSLAAANTEGPRHCEFTYRINGNVSYGSGSGNISQCLPGFTHQRGTALVVRSNQPNLGANANSTNLIVCNEKGTRDNGIHTTFFFSDRIGGFQKLYSTSSYTDPVWLLDKQWMNLICIGQ